MVLVLLSLLGGGGKTLKETWDLSRGYSHSAHPLSLSSHSPSLCVLLPPPSPHPPRPSPHLRRRRAYSSPPIGWHVLQESVSSTESQHCCTDSDVNSLSPRCRGRAAQSISYIRCLFFPQYKPIS